MKRGLMLLSVFSLVFAGTASAAVQQGDTELNFLGGWITENGADDYGDTDVLFLSAALGYFLTDNVQVAATGMGAWIDQDDAGNLDVYGVGARAAWHFMPTNQWVPYIGAQVLWVSAENGGSVDGTLWGPVGGLRYELNASNDFFVEGQYHLWDGDIGDILDDGFAIMVGIVHQFK
jgi:hypothetical protein